MGFEVFPEVYAHFSRVTGSLWQQCRSRFLTRDELGAYRWQMFLRAYGRSCDPKEAQQRFVAELAENPYWLPGAERFFAQLVANVSVVIVTNGERRIVGRHVELTGIGPRVVATVVAEEVGYAKPEAGIYRHALALVPGVTLGDSLMIGDTLTTDIQGAQALDMDACWYKPSGPGRLRLGPRVRVFFDHQSILQWLQISG